MTPTVAWRPWSPDPSCPCWTLLVTSLLLTFPAASALEQTPVERPDAAHHVHLKALSGSSEDLLEAFSYDSRSRTVTLGKTEVPLDEVLSIRLTGGGSASQAPQMLLLLRGGEELFVEPRDSNKEDQIVFEVPSVFQSADAKQIFRLPTEEVRALVFPARFTSPDSLVRFKRSLPGTRRRPIFPSAAAEIDSKEAGTPGGDDSSGIKLQKDLLLTSEGSRLEGILTVVGSEKIRFEADQVGALQLELEKIQAVTVADLDKTSSTSDAKPPESSLLVSLVDGGLLSGTLRSIDGAELNLVSSSLGEIRVPLTGVRLIEVQGERYRYLSDLDPVKATTKNLFVDSVSLRPVQRDANVQGGPLKIRNQAFRKGIGMRSHVRLDYSLGKEFNRLQAFAGIDDIARLTTIQSRRIGGGTAVFRVYVDNNVVFEKQLSYKDPIEPVDVSVKDGETLSLEVDYGPGLYVQDFADWADAKIIR